MSEVLQKSKGLESLKEVKYILYGLLDTGIGCANYQNPQRAYVFQKVLPFERMKCQKRIVE